MPRRPCALEAGAANDPASAEANGQLHRLRLGLDQPLLLRPFASLGSCCSSRLGDPKDASVTRRATYYGLDPQ